MSVLSTLDATSTVIVCVHILAGKLRLVETGIDNVVGAAKPLRKLCLRIELKEKWC